MNQILTSEADKDNLSSIFLLPSIQLDARTRSRFNTYGFINSFTSCNRLKYNHPVLFLLFKPEKFNKQFLNFYQDLSKNRNFLEEYDLGDNYLLIVFEIPEKFIPDYKFFLEGKYSKMSKDYQRLFPNTVFTKGVMKDGKYIQKVSSFYHIFNRTDYLKERWREKLGYYNTDIFDNIELYHKQNPKKEYIELLILV